MENNNIEKPKKNSNIFGKILILTLLSLMVMGIVSKNTTGVETKNIEEVTYSKLLSTIKDNKDKKMEITERNDGLVTLKVEKDEKTYTTEVPNENKLGEYIEKYNISYSKAAMPKGIGEIMGSVVSILIFVLIFIFIISMLKAGKSNQNLQQKMTKMDKTAKIPDVTMEQVGGILDETKEEINAVLESYKNREEAKKYGIRPIKGLLLHGPSGTGKTLLTKAIANSLNYKFYSISGSDFVEMFVGVGASRARDLFEEARKNSPSLIFIDEVDAIAGKRHPMGGNNEKENTLNQLLVELDGINENENVFVVAATNRLDMLDDAFVRSGRFDFKVKVDLPDLKGRREIIEIHSKNKPLAQEVIDQFDNLAKNTYGYSGADIENLFLVSATQAFSKKKELIDMEDIDYAIDRNILGNKGKKLDDIKTKERVAYHEAGHALLQVLLKEGSIRKATIAPRGDALGFVATIPEEIALLTYSELLKKVQMILAGGLGEIKQFKEHSLGVSGDVEQAKNIIEKMVDLGMGDDNFSLEFGDKNKNEKMKKIFDKAVEECNKVLEEYSEQHTNLALALLEKETLDVEEIEYIVLGKVVIKEEPVVEVLEEEITETIEVSSEQEVEQEVVAKELPKKIDVNKKPSHF